MKARSGIVAALVFSVTLASAQKGGSAAKANAGTGQTQPATSGSSTPGPYVIGPLDVLNISVWNDPKLSGFVEVRPDGIISMHLIGEIKADGLTIAELTKVVKDKLSAVMNDPEVNIQPTRINSKRVYVMGEVNRPGEMPLIGTMTVLDALSNAGGFKEFSSPKKIYVLRGDQKFKFNYNDVSKGKHMEQNIVLQNGDHIFVPE